MQVEIEIHSCASEKSIMSFPMGALCIKTAINTDGDLPKSAVFEHTLAESPEDEALRCANRKPRFVGLSTYIWNTEWMDEFALELKKLAPQTVIFAGGPQVSAYRDNYPEYLDFAVQGEGETAVVNNLKKIISGKKVSKLTVATPENLTELQSPFLTGNCNSAMENNDSILWEMTRGCPFTCAFCYESRGNRNVRNYPLERIKKEFEIIEQHGIQNVFVLDPTFNLDRDRAKEILRFLIENAPSDMHFTFEIRAELLDEEMAQLFATLNCSLQIGLQTSNEEVQKGISRKFSKHEFAEKIKLLNKSQAAFGVDIIIGLPGDTLSSFRQTVDYAVSLQPSNIDCFVLSLLPGTELAETAGERGLVANTDAERTLKYSSTFSEEDVKSAEELRDALDLFYTKGQACMWIHCILETLNITACNLLSLFAKWMKQTKRNEDEDIWILQDDFITSLFEKTQNGKLIPAIKSFMELHQGLCYVTDTCEEIQLDLSYTPEDLALLDRMSLKEFVKTHRMRHSNPILGLDDDMSVVFK